MNTDIDTSVEVIRFRGPEGRGQSFAVETIHDLRRLMS